MGKGDKKTAKGKRVMGTFGNSRKKKSSTPIVLTKKKVKAVAKEADKEPKVKKVVAKKTVAKKAPVKKAPVKKTTEAKEK